MLIPQKQKTKLFYHKYLVLFTANNKINKFKFNPYRILALHF